MLKPQDFRQTGYFVIDDKRCNIQELTCEQIRIHFGTGRSILVSGTGRDKKYTYRSGCMTDIGDILDADWFALARFIIERDGEQDLYNGLVEYVNGCAWLRSKSEREEYALDLHMARAILNNNIEEFLVATVGWTSQSLLNITETGSAHPQEVKNDV